LRTADRATVRVMLRTDTEAKSPVFIGHRFLSSVHALTSARRGRSRPVHNVHVRL